MEAFALSADAPRVPLPQRLLSDERLLRLIAAGNSQAFGTVYARYHAPLYAYCRSIVRDPDDARDALQNTMLKALAALGRREERELALKPWLFRIAHNESITLLRKRRPSEPLTDALSPPVGDTHGEVVSRERLTQLVEDLRELPDRQRGALIMREVNGLSYEEIAGALAISPGAARQTVFEARSALVEYGEGREVACANIRRSISDGDGRALRARRVRAHLRACNACRDFQSTLQVRRRDLALLAPGLSGGSVLALLQGVLGAGVAGTAGGATAGGAGLLGGSAASIFGGGAAKTVVAIVAASAAGAGAVKLGTDATRQARRHFQAAAAGGAQRATTASAASAGARSAGPGSPGVSPSTAAAVPNVLGRPDAALGVLPGRGRRRGAGAGKAVDVLGGPGTRRVPRGDLRPARAPVRHRGAGSNGWADDSYGDAFGDFSYADPDVYDGTAQDTGDGDGNAPARPNRRPGGGNRHPQSTPAADGASDGDGDGAADDPASDASGQDDPTTDDASGDSPADDSGSEPVDAQPTGGRRPHRGAGGGSGSGSGGSGGGASGGAGSGSGGSHNQSTPPSPGAGGAATVGGMLPGSATAPATADDSGGSDDGDLEDTGYDPSLDGSDDGDAP